MEFRMISHEIDMANEKRRFTDNLISNNTWDDATENDHLRATSSILEPRPSFTPTHSKNSVPNNS